MLSKEDGFLPLLDPFFSRMLCYEIELSMIYVRIFRKSYQCCLIFRKCSAHSCHMTVNAWMTAQAEPQSQWCWTCKFPSGLFLLWARHNQCLSLGLTRHCWVYYHSSSWGRHLLFPYYRCLTKAWANYNMHISSNGWLNKSKGSFGVT